METLELIEEQVATSAEDEILHFICRLCHPEGTREIAFCGTDVTDEKELATWARSQECVMCVEVLSTYDKAPFFGRLCPKGHVVY